MNRVIALVAVTATCVVGAACGSSEPSSESALHLDPRSDAVVAVDLNYDSGNWQQLKRLYAKAVQDGSFSSEDFEVPPTLDGALAMAATWTGLSFADDIKPLLGGTLQIGFHTEPAPPLSASARDLLEQVDESATRWEDEDGPQYFDFDGKRLDTRAVEAAYEEQRDPSTTVTAVYRVEDADALERVLGKLRKQGLESKPIAGIDGAQWLGDGVAVLGGDTIVAVMADDSDRADALLRDRLEATGEGAELPDLGEDFVAARMTPAVLGAFLDRDELQRALASTAAGRCAARRSGSGSTRRPRGRPRAWTSTGWPTRNCPCRAQARSPFPRARACPARPRIRA